MPAKKWEQALGIDQELQALHIAAEIGAIPIDLTHVLHRPVKTASKSGDKSANENDLSPTPFILLGHERPDGPLNRPERRQAADSVGRGTCQGECRVIVDTVQARQQ